MYLNLHFEKIKNPKDYHTMKMQFLSTEQLEQIHELTLDILENQGVWFKDSPEAKDIFKQNGCQVRDDQVFIPRKVFEECISRLPDRNELKICVTGLGMSESLNLGQGESHVGLIGNPYYIHEHGKGIRDLTETDTDDKFLIMDSLPNFKHDCCILINASQRAADSVFPDYSNTEVCLDYLKKRLLRRVRNGEKKPAMHSNISHGWEAVTRIHSPSILQPFDKMEVLRHAILNGPGESEALLSQDTPLIWCNPISPLQFHKEQVDEIIDSIKEYGPRCFIMFSPEVMLGGTGPVTMAGSLAQHNAEVMAGVVFTQLVAAGTPVIYGSVSGVMDFASCLKLVSKRALYMTEVGRGYPGAGLMAIVDKKRNLNYKRICSLCKDFELYVTLNNTKKQIVVGGAKRKLAELSKQLKQEGKLATILKVEGPFHTPIMRPAAEKLKKELEKNRLSIGLRPVIANVSNDAIVDPNHIKQELYEQIFKIVNWRGSVEKMIGNGGGLFIEVGPKKVLSNMIKDIDPSIPCLNVEDMESLEKTVNELKQQTKDLSEDNSQGEP